MRCGHELARFGLRSLSQILTQPAFEPVEGQQGLVAHVLISILQSLYDGTGDLIPSLQTEGGIRARTSA